MCGISIIVDGSGSALTGSLRRMHAEIPHRGPDGEGCLTWSRRAGIQRTASVPGAGAEWNVGIAFRRLRVLDPSPGADQPMGSPDESNWITFNGEIYNFREVRADLEKQGHRFRSSGDTEVILAAYREWGLGCFERLDGMWAIAILDLKLRRLVVSRDRIGIKPLYWHLGKNGRIYFASEIKQILAGTGERPVANRSVVSRYLEGWRSPCLDDTYFEGIELVPAATVTSISLDDPGRPAFETFWRLPARPGLDRDYGAAVDELERKLTSAVRTHSVADVRVGSLLSGGLDSTLLSVIGHRQRRSGDFPTFSFGFGESAPDVCELRYVDEVVSREGLTNRQTTFDSSWMTGNAASMVKALEEPPLASAALAQYRVFEAVRADGVTVALDGEASDELFGGYPYHQRLVLLERLRREGLGGFWRELSLTSRNLEQSRLRTLDTYFGSPLRRRFRSNGQPALISGGYVSTPRAGLDAMKMDRIADDSSLNQLLYRELRWGNVKIILLYTDKNSMAHSVEARVPYLDLGIVDLAFSMPALFKAGEGQRKRILRDVARRYLPRSITERRDRMGFATPEERFLRSALTAGIREDIERELLEATDLFRVDAVRGALDRFEDAVSGDFRLVWRLWMLALWRREFGVSL